MPRHMKIGSVKHGRGERSQGAHLYLMIVYNRRLAPPGAVYVGRPTKWGNPFIIGRDGDRITVIRKYLQWLGDNVDLMADIFELRGKSLSCWCAPQACHADVLMELANA